MKAGNLARILLMATPFLAGCGNFWQAPSSTSSSSCTSNCTTASSESFYILNAGTSPGIVGASVQSGSLTALSGSPWILSWLPYSMAIAPTGNYLMVSGTSGVWAFPITNGTLGTPVQVTQDATAEAIQIDVTGSWLVEALPQTNGTTTDGVTIAAIPVNTTTGAPNGAEETTSFTVTNASLAPNQMAISGDNRHIFVALGAGGTIVVPFNGSESAGNNPIGSPADTIPVVTTNGGTALSVAVDPGTTPRLFYIGETLASGGTTGGLRAFNYSSLGSTLTQATGSPIASGGLAPNYILPLSAGTYAGQYVYVANGQGTSAGNVTGFTITASSAATPVYTVATDTTTAAGEQPLGMAEDSTGTFVFEVGSAGSPYFDAYTFDTTVLGQLDSQLTATTAASSIAIVAVP